MKLFVRLPSKYLMQKQEQVVVEEAGGYTKLDDGCGFEVDWKRKTKEELELKPSAYWEQRGGAEIQVLGGDAFRPDIRRCEVCECIGVRAISATLLRGHKTAFKPVVVWEGPWRRPPVRAPEDEPLLHCAEGDERPLLVSMAISDPDFGFGVDPGRLRGYPLAHLAGTWW
jgi:hypothetical protein